MPISIIVGGQFGSEGKGKVAHYFAQELNATCAVRCGGSNSGHTVVTDNNEKLILRHLPTASIIKGIKSFLSAGSYIDLDVLLSEIKQVGITKHNLFIDSNAVIINKKDKEEEISNHNLSSISSTMSGTGNAVLSRIKRLGTVTFAKDIPELQDYICNVSQKLNEHLEKNERVIIEGTQGYGLSVIHSPHYPYVTSRDTTAAGFLSECGLSPLYVDDIILVLRLFPIRVSGSSGPLKNETTWENIREQGGHSEDISEYTSVTDKLRRVAYFDSEIVKQAISVNKPTRIVLNHVDLLQTNITLQSKKLLLCVKELEKDLATLISYVGLGPDTLEEVKNSFENISPKSIATGMLSSPQIKFCISQGLLVTHKTDSSETLLKNVHSAIYKMRIGKKAWGHDKHGKMYIKKENNKTIILEPNSLTFVTTWENFNLPKDIIARFNLKSGLVHKGLLLGTGPIVDPEFTGHLLIPLHNFSNTPIELSPGDSFINVEFTKTLPVETIGQKYSYVENTSAKFKIEDYVNRFSFLPTSSIHKRFIEFSGELEEVRKFQLWGAAAVVIGVFSLVFSALSMHFSVRESIENSTTRETQYLKTLATPLEEVSDQLQGSYKELNEKIITLEKELKNAQSTLRKHEKVILTNDPMEHNQHTKLQNDVTKLQTTDNPS